MGLASSSLPGLTVLALEVFHEPLVKTLWFNNRTYTGWAIALASTYFWWLVRVGFNLSNPLLPFVTFELFIESIRLYAGWFVLFAALAAIIGWLICVVFDIREPIPFYAISPTFYSYAIDTAGLTPCQTDLAAVKRYDCECNLGLQRWCYDNIEPPYWHTFVGILLELWTVSIPSVLFAALFANLKFWGFFISLGMKIIGYLFAGLFWYYRTDLYVWGPTEYNTAPRRLAARNNDNSHYAYDPVLDKGGIIFRRTELTVIRNAVIMGVIDVVLFFIIGGILTFPVVLPDFNLVIGLSLALLLVIGLLLLILGLIFSQSTSAGCDDQELGGCRPPPQQVIVEQPVVPEVCPFAASSTTTTTTNTKSRSTHNRLERQVLSLPSSLKSSTNQATNSNTGIMLLLNAPNK